MFEQSTASLYAGSVGLTPSDAIRLQLLPCGTVEVVAAQGSTHFVRTMVHADVLMLCCSRRRQQ